jgi:hypothetical protein
MTGFGEELYDQYSPYSPTGGSYGGEGQYPRQEAGSRAGEVYPGDMEVEEEELEPESEDENQFLANLDRFQMNFRHKSMPNVIYMDEHTLGSI